MTEAHEAVMVRRRIVSSGAGRSTAAGEFTLLPGCADLGAPPDGASEGRGQESRPSPHSAVTFVEDDDAEGSVSGWECAMPDPSWVRMDRFALADVRRRHRLTPATAYLLDSLVRLVDYREPHVWTCTLQEIGEFTGLSRNSITSGLDRLVMSRLVAIHEPFRQGRSGMWGVLIYHELVVPTTRQKRAQYAPEPNQIRTNRATEQGFRGGSIGIEGEGGIDARVPLTRDRPALGAYLRVAEAFPGAEEVS